jgi:very-short-patch-repair endonuclease
MNLTERLLWSRINSDKTGFDFRRYYPVGPYVLDYYFCEALLCVELDSECHTTCADKDTLRDKTF